MRTTVDIPDEMYRQLKVRAAAEGGTVKQLLLRGADSVLCEPSKKTLKRLKLPFIDSAEPGTLHLYNDQIYDLIGFP